MPHQPVPAINRRNAKTMRRRMTAAEFRLWHRLRAHGLRGLGFRRQAPLGPFIADFLCPAARLIVEVDGHQHGLDGEAAADRRRTAWLVSEGFAVLRFSNREVLAEVEAVCTAIADAALRRLPKPPPEAG